MMVAWQENKERFAYWFYHQFHFAFYFCEHWKLN
jgi:hypothetical protein